MSWQKVGETIKRFLKGAYKELTTADSFSGDWYGWATNQISHSSLGVFITWLACVAAFLMVGDLPFKINVFSSVAFIYVMKELVLDTWRGWDTIEDFLFVVVYGVGGTLLAFDQIVGDTVIFSVFGATPIFSVFCIHLFVGSIYRFWKNAGKT